MRPELFTIPIINVSIKSYGVMMVVGFLAALLLARHLCRKLGENPDHITNFGVYALLAGVVGARVFHVIHYWPRYADNWTEIFAIWSGGLEFLGGFIGALTVMVIYFRRHKLSVMRFLDILAPALMLGLAFGRIGCFLNGCCFGAPCNLPWAVRFPAVNLHTHRGSGCQAAKVPEYSIPFDYQITPDRQRRPDGKPLLQLPPDYFDGYMDNEGHWVPSLSQVPQEKRKDFFPAPIPPAQLTPQQLQKLENGSYRMVAIHPAQIYSSLNGFFLCLVLYLVLTRWYRFTGEVFGLLLILYGIARFILEALRNSSPLEFDGLTISQNLCIIAFITGIVMLIVLRGRPMPEKPKG